MLPMKIPPNTSSELPGKVEVLLAGSGNTYTALGGIFHHLGCRLRCVATCRELIACANENRTAVIICEQNLPDGDWISVLSVLQSSRECAHLIVTSLQSDSALWAEVLNRGGYDVLCQPFDRDEVLRVVTSAWRRQNNPH